MLNVLVWIELGGQEGVKPWRPWGIADKPLKDRVLSAADRVGQTAATRDRVPHQTAQTGSGHGKGLAFEQKMTQNSSVFGLEVHFR